MLGCCLRSMASVVFRKNRQELRLGGGGRGCFPILKLGISSLTFEKEMGDVATRKLWKGVLGGGAAGLTGTLAMIQFQTAWGKVLQRLTTNNQPISSGTKSEQESEDTDAAKPGLAP